jgi:uncharacterized oxidoreductase
MYTSNNTILITGGGSGIGFATARLFSEKGNKVIIVGRNELKLKQAASRLNNVIAIKCDITNEEEVNKLVNTIKKDYPDLNIVMNNAGKAYLYSTADQDAHAYEKAQDELTTNFLAPVRLTELLLPVLKQQKEAAVINISSIVSFAPGMMLPTYSATKAALHSWSQTLRLSLRGSSVKIFEVMPPLVDTELAEEITGEKLAPSVIAEAIVNGLEAQKYEIQPGQTASLYKLFLHSPVEALHTLNGIS